MKRGYRMQQISNTLNFTGLSALFFNCTLTKSPGLSHTERLITVSQRLLERHGVTTELIRPIDHDIAIGVWPDMREHGWRNDERPEVYKKVMKADNWVSA